MQRSAQMLQQQNGTYLSRRLRVRHERREERRGGGEATSKSVFGKSFPTLFFHVGPGALLPKCSLVFT